jgi:ATP-binding cassette subfamily B protein
MLVGFVVRTAPVRSAFLATLAIVDGALVPALMAATGLVVARAERAVTGGLDSPAGRELLAALVLVGVLFAADQALAPVRDTIGASIGSVMGQRRRERLLAVALRPYGIAHLENPELADDIRRAGDIEWDVGPLTRIVGELAKFVSLLTAATGSAVLLVQLAWWPPIVLFASAALSHVLMHGNVYEQIREKEEHTQLERRADYFRDLSLDPPMAKETRLFGLAGFLADQTRKHRLAFLSHVWRARRLQRGPAIRTVVAITVAHGVVLAYLAASTLNGAVSASELTVYIQAIGGVAMLGFGSGATDPWWVYQGTATIPHLLRLEKRDLSAAKPRGTMAAKGTPRNEIRLEGVRFGYDGRLVLDGLDLTIPAGSSLAIVGGNGAGKTTLLKLLARLYDPDEGRVLVDGQDLRTYDLASWRRQLAVIFQDFVKYELSARANVAFGRLDSANDDDADRRAADRASALELIESLPAGWDTTLARQYRGGVDLSGGQWQRIALARALRAAEGGARLLVLDEPTANLDVRAEAELFDRFLELTAGTTTILVTHRLSTVRHADRIAVLDRGRVTEVGTHDELLVTDGLYARMFRLQADRFAKEPRR